jgi:hypothetical protein
VYESSVSSVLLSVIGCSTPDTRPSDAVFDELMRKSGLWIQLAQVEPMMQAGVSQAQARTTALTEEDLAHLQEAIASASPTLVALAWEPKQSPMSGVERAVFTPSGAGSSAV